LYIKLLEIDNAIPHFILRLSFVVLQLAINYI